MNINKILFITLSNIGDVILTLPALDYLKEKFPQAQFTVMVGPRSQEIFKNNPYINKLIIYDKYAPLRQKVKLFFGLRKEHFDLVVDFRNTFFGALLPARFRTSPFLYIPSNIRHMKERNLYRLQRALKMPISLNYTTAAKFLFISQQDREHINRLLEKNNISPADKIVIVAPVARGAARRWEKTKFSQLSGQLSKDYKVILVGALSDKAVIQDILSNCAGKVFDFSGLTNQAQLAYLIQRSALLIACDTGVTHLASYMGAPVLVLVGGGDEKKYGPWSSKETAVISRELSCRPCKDAQCRFGTLDCLRLIKVEDVLKAAKGILASGFRPQTSGLRHIFKRILIVRTDRIGDVLLSTPVIRALREQYSNAYIAMMISPYTKDIIEGNPYLDEAIIYDKDNRHKSWMSSVKFSLALRKKKFDLAIILHPTNRAHLMTFLAGIRTRAGYDRKLGFLLTDRIKHIKQFGEKHELEYNFDLLKYFGISTQDKELFMPIRQESELWAEELFNQLGINEKDALLAIHPGASCPSKIWPGERFAEAADRLVEKYGFRVVLVSGPKDMALAERVIRRMRHPAINLAGKTSVSQLASVLKRCKLFISCDSGPVHIASAVGTPVISIFGRNQKGLSPKRWGPVGKKDCVIHKEVGCIECLAHNCKKDFACLKAISVDEVVGVAEEILKK